MMQKGQSKMSNIQTAMNGARASGYVEVSEAPATGMITLRGDLADAAVQKAITSVMGAGVPATLAVTDADAGQILWMSPDELMIVCAYDQAEQMVADLTAFCTPASARSPRRVIMPVAGASDTST